MRHFHFYDVGTGLFTGEVLSIGTHDEKKVAAMLLANTPEGCGTVEGEVDYQSQRVDLETLSVVDYVPPAPGDDYEWSVDSRRWNKSAAVVAWEAEQTASRAQLEDIDRRSIRRLRELFAEDETIKALEDEAAPHRAKVREPKP